MADYIIINGELYHHGVKGMKWGVRKFQKASTDLDRRKAAYKKAKKDYSRAYNKADSRRLSAFSPSKKHRETQDKRWEDVGKAAEKAERLRKEYKSAKKDFNKHTTVGQKINRAVSSKGGQATTKALRKIGVAYMTDQIFFGGAGTKAAKSAIKTIGRTAISTYVYARGGRDIRWYD